MKKLLFLFSISFLTLTSIIFIFKPQKKTEAFEALNDTNIVEDIAYSDSNTESNSSKDKIVETFNTNNTKPIQNIIYTMTLELTEPVKIGDEYSWMLTSEPGQLSNSLNILGIGPGSPTQIFGDDTTIIFPEEAIDIEKINNKLDLDISTVLTDNIPITITYSESDIIYPPIK